MKPEEIKLTDWLRILVGEVPGSFYVELFIRAIVIYLLLMIAMRLLGKRMSSQLGRNDLAAMVTLAAAIGVPIQAPDRGLLPMVMIAIVVVCIGRWIANKAFKNQSFEKLSQGNLDVLVKDSVLDLERMKEVRLSRERLVAELRSNGIKQLGEVKRLYMEASGSFTLIKEEAPKAGLSVLPRWDDDFNARFKKSDKLMVCQTCGFARERPFNLKEDCTHCHDCKWTEAVEEE
jgi:uncharacterized membrane protein YcaP (DUF421 family)